MKFNSIHIPSFDSEIEEGIIYAYSEGSFKAMVKVLENNSDNELIEFKLFIIKSNHDDMPAGKIFSVNAIYYNFGYAGMWRLLDTERFDEEVC